MVDDELLYLLRRTCTLRSTLSVLGSRWRDAIEGWCKS